MPTPTPPSGATVTHLPLSKLESTAAAPATAAFGVADYLQLAGLSRRSVALTVRELGRPVGRILVESGQPRYAEDPLGKGESAFRRLVLREGVDVACEPLNATAPKNLNGSLEYLLIAAAQEADEQLRRTTRPLPFSGVHKAPLKALAHLKDPTRTSEATTPTTPAVGLAKASEESGVHGSKPSFPTAAPATPAPPAALRVEMVPIQALRELLNVFTEYFGPAARLVFKQHLAALGVTAQTLPRNELGMFLLELAKTIPSAHQQQEFMAKVQAYRTRSLL